MKQIRLTLKVMRCSHYIKNIMILIPLIFSGQVFDLHLLGKTFMGIFAFSLISSAVYIINDINDLEKDRAHPVKRMRPIASGAMDLIQAKSLVIFCILGAMLFQAFAGEFFPNIFYLLIYLVLNIMYSRGLKDKPMIDVIILVSGFLIRVLYGGALANVLVSGWLFLTVLSGAFYLGLGKRRNELQKHGDKDTRNVLKYYNYQFLDKNMYMCMGLANTFYALWAMENPHPYMLYTVPIVLVITIKYSLDVEGNSDGDPIEVILHDKMIMIIGGLYAAVIICILYGGRLYK